MTSERAVFQLRKYSWADDKSSDGRSNYTHITAENLCLIVEGTVDPHGALALQVVQATRVLEAIDLAIHIRAASSTRQTFLEAGRHLPDRQLPTYAVSSGAKLAITYRQDDGQAHRMQVALSSQIDCERIVSFLRCRGMIFVDPAQSRNDSVPASTRPTTASTAFSRLIDRVPPHSQSQSHVPPLFARNEQEAPRQIIIDRPTTREMFQQPGTELFPSGATSGQSYSNASKQNHATSDLFSSSRFSGTQSISDLDRTSNTSYHVRLDYQDANFSPRGTDTVSIRSEPQQQQPPLSTLQALPPPRQLPFASDLRARSSSSSALSLPALPKPQPSSQGQSCSFIRDDALSRDVNNRTTQRKRKPDSIDNLDVRSSDDADMPPPTTRPRSSVSRSSPKIMNELLHGKRPTRKTPVPKKQNTSTKRKTNGSIDRIQEIASVDNQAREADSDIETQPAMSSEDIARIFGQPELEEYSKLDTNARDKILQQFIATVLGDKAFEKLCEDVSVCWQRLAFDK